MGDTAKMLLQLATMDECEAITVTDADQVAGDAPNWSEIILNITRNNKTLVHFLTRADGELIIEILHEILHPNAGKPIRGMLWDKLDELMDVILDSDAPVNISEVKAEARGIATALSLMENPYAPSIDQVRKTARERWEVRNGA